MSFGFSPSDLITLLTLTTKAYQGWKSACGEYADITALLETILILLERLDAEAKTPNTILVRDEHDRKSLGTVFFNCSGTVRELDDVVSRYSSLGLHKSRERNWQRFRFGTKNLVQLRTKLHGHIAALSAYLQTVGLGALTRIERDVHALPERMQQLIDGLAADIRAGRREGTIMSSYEDDDMEVWKQFRRELIGDGIRSSVIYEHKPLLKRYLRGLAAKGMLQESAPDNTQDLVPPIVEPNDRSTESIQRELVLGFFDRSPSADLQPACEGGSRNAESVPTPPIPPYVPLQHQDNTSESEHYARPDNAADQHSLSPQFYSSAGPVSSLSLPLPYAAFGPPDVAAGPRPLPPSAPPRTQKSIWTPSRTPSPVVSVKVKVHADGRVTLTKLP